MSFDQDLNSYMSWDMMAPENFNGAADTPGDAQYQTGWLINGVWYPLQDHPTWADNAPQQEYHSDFTGHGSRPLASSQAHLDHPVPYPYWIDPNWADLSPSHGNSLLPLNTTQQLAPNTYEPLYFPSQGHNIGPASYDDLSVAPSYHQSHQLPGDHLVPCPHWVDSHLTGVSPSYGNNQLPTGMSQQSAPVEGGYYNDKTTRSSVCLHPDLPLGEGIFSGMSNAVVGKAADTSISAPPKHLHRKAGKKGGKKGEVMRFHDCAYDGKEEPLERGHLGYGKPSAIYQRLSRLKTEALDSVILREGEAHGVDPNNGSYICRAQASIFRGIWRRDERVCNKRLQDKDCYRRHLEEKHFGLGRTIYGKNVRIETRIRRALEDIESQKAEKEGRPTKKRKRASDEEECVGSSPSEREGEMKKRRRAGTA